MKNLLNPTQVTALGTHIWAYQQINMANRPENYYVTVKDGKPTPSFLLTADEWSTLPLVKLIELTTEEQKEYRDKIKPQHYIDTLSKHNEHSVGALYEYLEDVLGHDPLSDIILTLVEVTYNLYDLSEYYGA